MFGPEYQKIQTVFKRDDRNVIMPGEWTLPELDYLANSLWRWTEKVDGTNIRLHWDGNQVTVGGRTDNAQVPATLVNNLASHMEDTDWKEVFPDADDVTVYGEGYGAKIQSGGQYRQDQALIVFDVRVGPWWLSDENVADVAGKLGLDVVPTVGVFTPKQAWARICAGGAKSEWPDAQIEGYVGRPLVDLFNRKGERIICKMKVKDFRDYERRGSDA